jgi:hypothetical protein
MLTYATIFIASIVVAVVSLLLYRVIAGTSESVLNSKVPINVADNTLPYESNGVFATINDQAFPTGHTSHSTPNHVDGQVPAMPIEDNNDWSVREKSSHCSLYDVNPVEAPVEKKRNVGWPHREDRQEASGSAYKVSRKLATHTANPEDNGKPWGW